MAAKKRAAAAAAATDGDAPNKLNPMERKKLRRQRDKERRALQHDDGDTGPKAYPKAQEEASSAPREKKRRLDSGPALHMNHFRDLTTVEEVTRVNAVRSLATELLAIQKIYDGTGKADEAGMEADMDEGLDGLAEPVKYTLRRLVRGISSSRECARQGFALGLTAILNALPEIKVQSVTKMVIKLIEVTSGMRGQEARDNCFGRLFSFAALSRSGRVSGEWKSDNSSSVVKDVVGEVVRSGTKKRYFTELAASIILDLAKQLPDKALRTEIIEAPGMYTWFEKAGQVGDPDALYLALKLHERVGADSRMFGELLPNPFSAENFFTRDHLMAIASCFQESIFCLPRIHNVWPLVINILVPKAYCQEDIAGTNPNKKHKKNKNSIDEYLRTFCDVIIEESLFLSSHDRKYLAFQVLLILVQRVPTSCIKVILSSRIVHGLMDILSDESTWLYTTGQHFLKELTGYIGKDDDRRIAAIISLQKYSGGTFDSITKTKTVRDLLSMCNSKKSCLCTVQSLVSLFLDDESVGDVPSDQSETTDENSEAWTEDSPEQLAIMQPVKNWVIETVPQVLKNLKLNSERLNQQRDFRVSVSLTEKFDVQIAILKFLAVQGLFSASLGTEVTSFELEETLKWPKVALSSSLRDECIRQIQLLIEAAQKELSFYDQEDMESCDLGSSFMRFIRTVYNIPSVSLCEKLGKDDEEAFKKLLDVEATLFFEERAANSIKDSGKMHAMRYLLIQLLLQILRCPGQFAEPAVQLTIFCQKVFSVGDNSIHNAVDEGGAPEPVDVLVGTDNSIHDEVDEGGAPEPPPEPMDVLVGTLLSLLPHISSPALYAIEQAFRVFCENITATGILDMLRIVKKNLKPPRHRIDDESDDDEVDDDEEDLIEIEESDEPRKGAVETSDVDSHPDEDESDAEADVDLKRLEGDDDSDGMDDDAMFRMDAYLSHMFKERKTSQSDSAQSQLILFKLRVLTLLEIYLQKKNSGSSPHTLKIYSTLLNVYVRSHDDGDEKLKQRVGKILQNKILKAKEYPKGEEIELATLERLLAKALKAVSRSRVQTISSVAESSVFWILKIINSNDYPEAELERVFEMLRGTMSDFFNNKQSRLKHKFLKEVVSRHPWVGGHLLGFLLENCAGAMSECRKVQTLEVVDCIMKQLAKSHNRHLLEAQIKAVCSLLHEILGGLPQKHSRRTETRRICKRMLNVISAFDLEEAFVAALDPDTFDLCKSELGDAFRRFADLRP